MATTTPFTAKYAVVSKSKTGGTGLLDLDLSYGTITMDGQNIQYVGSAIVDAVFLRPGVTVDFTGAGAGADKLYLSGAYADYAFTVETVGKVSKLVLTRTVNGLTEKATVAAGDKLVFADGVLTTDALIDYKKPSSTVAAPTLDVIETSSAPELDAVDAKLAPAITMTGLNKAGVTFAQGVQGAAVKVVGTAGVDTVYVKAGTQVDASGVGADVDKIYFTGTYADYTKTAVGKTLVFQRTINGVVEKVTLANTGDTAIFADGKVATADIAASLRKGSATVVTLDGASITTTDSDVQYIVFDKTSSTALASAKPFKLGDNLVFTVKFSKGVDVTGTPKLALDMGGKTVYATYDAAATGASKTDLKFKYTVQSTDLDANGVSVAQGGVATSAIDLNGGAIKLTGTTTSAAITQNPAMGDAAAAKVDGIAPVVTKTYTVVENTAADKVKTPSSITLVADEGVTWSDLAGVDADYFKLEGAKLSFKESANFEKQSSYNVTVKATDAAGNEKTEAVVVKLTDVQEAPVVAAPLADQTFALGAAWTTNKFVIPTGSLKDEDAASAGKLTYTAKLSSGAALPKWLLFDAATQTFSVDSTVIKALPTIKTAPITVRVTVTDEGKRSVFDDFKLTFTDLPVVKSLTVTDGDATNGAALGKAGESLTFTIKLSEAVTSTTDLTAVFTVGGKEVTATAAAVATATDTLSFTAPVPALANGGVSLKSLVADASGQIKNATGKTLLPVTAGAVADASYVVDTQAPTITATYSLAENTTADTPLKSVSLGASEAVTWSGLTGADASYFTLGAGADAGKLLFSGKANFEAKSSYAVTVTGTDKAGNATQEAVTINLTDVAETNSLPTGAVTVTGTSTQGQTLTASNTLADADGMGAVSYKWQVSADGSTGWTDISGATASTFTLAQAQVGKHVRVLASYTDGEKTTEAVASAGTVVANVNDPVTGTVTFTGTAAQGQTLTASNTLADVDGLGTVSYKWQVSANGTSGWTDISGATANTLTLAEAQVGKYVRVVASYTDAFGTPESLSSSATLSTVANVNDAPTGTVTFTGTATQGQVLTAANTLADVDGMGTVSYKWEVSANGTSGWTAISGATASTFTLAEAQVGKYVRVTASYTDGQGAVEAVSSSPTAAAVANLNDLPTGSVSLSGTAANGSTLTADTSTLVDLDGLGTFSYKWQTSSAASGQPWTDISGATGSTYSLTSNEIGKYVRAVVSYTDAHGTPEVVNSSVTSNAVTNINTLPTGSVTFTGAATQGQVLTAVNTLADTDGLGIISYKWEVSNDGSTGWSAISGATASTFTLGQAQVGKYVRVTASYTDGQGAVEAVSSSPTAAAVANLNDLPTGSVSLSGTAANGSTLTADTSTLVDLDGLGTFSYKWQTSSAASGQPWTDISGATGSTYSLTSNEIGKYVRAVVSYTDAHGTPEVVNSSVTSSAVTNINTLPTGSVTFTGTATQGQVLTAVNTLADADGLGIISYKWEVSNDGSTGWTAISGATASTFTLAEAQVGKYVRVTASYTDGQGAVEAVSSSPTAAAVANLNDLPTGSVSLSGTAANGSTLTADTSTLVDLDGLGTFSYKWQTSSAASGQPWTDISGATGSTYSLTSNEIGKYVRAVVSYTDAHGTPEVVNSSVTSSAVTNINTLPTGSVTFTGTATQGQVLTAANTLADVDGLGTISYKWEVSADGSTNWTAISGATASTFTLGQAQVGKYVRVTASYTDGQGAVEAVSSSPTAAAVANLNDLPTGSVSLSGTAANGSTLTADTSTLVDLDGLGTFSYKWQTSSAASGQPWTDISGATGSTYSLTSNEIGKYVRAVVSYTDAHGTPEVVNSSVTSNAVTNINTLPTGSVTFTGTATQGQVLTAANTLADTDGLGTISYKWEVSNDGSTGWSAISGATASTYTLAQAQVGKYVRVTASYTDGFGASESRSSSPTAAVANINDAPTGTVTFTGTATQGQVLTAANTLADVDGLGTISYKWEVSADGSTNWTAISGATASTFTLAEAQVGKYVRVTASYTDGQGAVEAVSSSPTAAAVANLNDLPTGSVSLSGTAANGSTLTADTSTLVDLDGLGTFSYKWQTSSAASGQPWTDISGATGSTYSLTSNEIGKYVRAVVSYTDAHGTPEVVNSSVTSNAVTNINTLPTGSVTFTGTATQGQVLTAVNTLADTDGLGIISYKWEVSNDGSTGWSAISGATASTFTLGQAQVGKYVRVTASYTDGQGAVEAVSSSPTAAAVANINDLPTGTVTFTGTATQGQVLTAANTLADVDGLGTISYKWEVSNDGSTGWSAISGATASTFTLLSAQVGKYVRVTASYTDGFGSSESLSSTPTAAAVASVPSASITSVTSSKAASTVNTTVDAGAVTYTVTFSNPIKSGTTLSSSNFKVFANDGTTEIGTISSVNKTSDSVWAVAVSFNTGVDQSASTLKFIASGATDAYDNAMSDHVAQNAGTNFTQSVDTAVPTFSGSDNSGGVINNLESDASTDSLRLIASATPTDMAKWEMFDKNNNSLGSDISSASGWYVDVGNLAALRAATTIDANTGRGTYAITAKATDDAGNVTSAVYNLTFDVLAQGATLNAALTAVDDTSFDANGKFTITGLAYESGSVKLEWWKTGSTAADLTSTSSVVNIGTSNAWSVTFNKKALQDLAGSGTFKLVTTDSAGNTVSQDFSATVSPSSGGSMLSSLVTHAVNSLTDAGNGTYTINSAFKNAVWTANNATAFSRDGTASNTYVERSRTGTYGTDYPDIFVYDAVTDTTKLVTHTFTGAPDSYWSGATPLTYDQAMLTTSNSTIAAYAGGNAQYVAFTGNAGAFGMGGATNAGFVERNGSVRNTGAINDIMVFNVATGETKLVSHANSGSLDSGYSTSTYLTGEQAMTWDAEEAHNFQKMSDQYLTFSAANAGRVGRGGSNNISFYERTGPLGGGGVTDLFVYDAVSQETKLITHLAAGAGNTTYSGATPMSAAESMNYGTTNATDASVAGMSGRYTAFQASNISDLGAGGATNAGFIERIGSVRNTGNFKDLLVFDAVTGETKLVSHASTSDLDSGYSTSTYYDAATAAMAGAEVQTTFTSMDGQYLVFQVGDESKIGQGGASNARFNARAGSAGYSTGQVTDLMVFDYLSGQTKLVTHAAAGDAASYWSGEANTLSASEAMISGTNRVTAYEGQSGQYVTFSANDISSIGSGGVNNTGFAERPGGVWSSSVKDLMVFDAVSGVTKLITHVAAGAGVTLYSGATPLSADAALNYGTARATDATFVGASGKYVAFTASNISDLGQGGVNNTAFSERDGSSGYNTTNFKDLLVFDASTGITKLVSHAAAGELTSFWSGVVTTISADAAMSIGTRATDVQYAGIAGKYLFFTASNATFFGSGGAANTKFTDNNTAATDLFAYNMDNGTTQLLSHASGDVNKGGNNSVAFAGSDGTYAYYTTNNVAGFGNATAWTDTQTTKPDLVAVLLA